MPRKSGNGNQQQQQQQQEQQNQMADEEIFSDLQQILNAGSETAAPSITPTFPQSASLPVMPSHVPLTVPVPAVTQRRPYIRIVEEPTNKIIRFRYKCEGRTAGSIAGMNSTPEAKTYPTIEIMDYNGPIIVAVSCVTREKPYRQHPHWLVSKEEMDNCKSGVYSKRLNPGERRLELQKVGIQCVKKTDVRESLLAREKRNIDPFHAKFDHKDRISSINLYELRLCYQAFIKVDNGYVPLDPVVSSPIYGKSNELTINRLCSCSSKLSGGDQIILLCEKISKDDIKVRFFETNQAGEEVWEAYADFQPTDIYKQTAIVFKTPRYHNQEIQRSVQVELQLERPSDKATSAAMPFEYYPNPDTLALKCRLDARSATEKVKRKLSGIMNQNQKQSKMLFTPAQAQSMMSMDVHNGPRASPNGIPEIKTEQVLYELDSSRNCPSVASSYKNYNFPASPNSNSSCSTADSIAPLMQLQRLQEQSNQNVTLSVNSHASTWNTTTMFNGGSITPTNFNNPMTNTNGHIEINSALDTNFVPVISEQQQQHQQSQQQAQPQQQPHQQQEPDENPSISDLISGYTPLDYMDYTMDPDMMDLQATLCNMEMAKNQI